MEVRLLHVFLTSLLVVAARGVVSANLYVVLTSLVMVGDITSANLLSAQTVRKMTACEKTNNMIVLDCGSQATIKLIASGSILGRSKCETNDMQQQRCCPGNEDCVFSTSEKKENHWRSLVTVCNDNHSCSVEMTFIYLKNVQAVRCEGRKTDYETVAYTCHPHDGLKVTSTLASSIDSSLSPTTDATNSTGQLGQEGENQQRPGRGDRPEIVEFLVILGYVSLVAVLVLSIPLTAIACYFKRKRKQKKPDGDGEDKHDYEEIHDKDRPNHERPMTSRAGEIPPLISRPLPKPNKTALTNASPEATLNGGNRVDGYSTTEPVYHELDEENIAPKQGEVIYSEPDVNLTAGQMAPPYQELNQYSEANDTSDKYATLERQTSRESEYSTPSQGCLCGKCESGYAQCPSGTHAYSPASNAINEEHIMNHSIVEENALYSSGARALPREGHYSLAF